MLEKDKEKEKTKEDPVQKLEEIESKYAMDYVDAPESLGLEKKEFNDLSDDELYNKAVEKIGSSERGKKDIEDKYNAKLEVLNQDAKRVKENSKAKTSEIENVYNNKQKNISDDALKRGLARSSIVIGKIAQVESERATVLQKELDDLSEKIMGVENEINKLNEDKEKALDDFDLSYAKAIEENIKEKRAELDKQKEEVIEFNNKVDELEAEYKISLDKQKQAKLKNNMQIKAEYGYTPDELKMQEEKYNYMINYLNSMTRSEAVNFLLNDEKIQKLLGDKFMAVYAYVRNRKE